MCCPKKRIFCDISFAVQIHPNMCPNLRCCKWNAIYVCKVRWLMVPYGPTHQPCLTSEQLKNELFAKCALSTIIYTNVTPVKNFCWSMCSNMCNVGYLKQAASVQYPVHFLLFQVRLHILLPQINIFHGEISSLEFLTVPLLRRQEHIALPAAAESAVQKNQCITMSCCNKVLIVITE